MATSATHSLNGTPPVPPPSYPADRSPSSQADRGFQVIRRNGSFSAFDTSKISVAITKAFVAVEGTSATSSWPIRGAARKRIFEASWPPCLQR